MQTQAQHLEPMELAVAAAAAAAPTQQEGRVVTVL